MRGWVVEPFRLRTRVEIYMNNIHLISRGLPRRRVLSSYFVVTFFDDVMQGTAPRPQIMGTANGEYRDVAYADEITSSIGHRSRNRLVDLVHEKG